jgi:hypothetical protein
MENEHLKQFMLQIDGIYYAFDLDAYHEAVKMPPKKVIEEYEDENGKIQTREVTEDGGLNLSKYELIKYVIEIVLEGKGMEDMDSAMGMTYALKQMPFHFKISFNTLLQYGIMKPI